MFQFVKQRKKNYSRQRVEDGNEINFSPLPRLRFNALRRYPEKSIFILDSESIKLCPVAANGACSTYAAHKYFFGFHNINLKI